MQPAATPLNPNTLLVYHSCVGAAALATRYRQVVTTPAPTQQWCLC
jgi:hypothetical protein